jgi:cysteine desulfurase
MRVYFDNAATTPLNASVIQAMHDVMTLEYGNPSSIHSKGRTARTLVEDARKTVANILSASTGEIFFTSCATESNNMAIMCSIRDLGVNRIISSPTEHPCVLNTLKSVAIQDPQVEILWLDVDSKGNISADQLTQYLEASDRKTLVSLMHGNNEIGTMIDIEEVSKICKSHNALFHCDTVQTIGKFPIDLSKTYVSFLSGSGHKIYGPKGIGIIYINNDNMIKPLINGGGQERTLRSGTENIYGIVGFAKSLEVLSMQKEDHHNDILKLRNHFKDQAAIKIPQLQYNGNQEELFLPHILSVTIPKTMKTDLIMFNLDINGICASAGSACSSGSERDSHVLEAIKSPLDRKTIRFSFSHLNTTEEIDFTIDKLMEIME